MAYLLCSPGAVAAAYSPAAVEVETENRIVAAVVELTADK